MTRLSSISADGLSDPGLRRSSNEDAWLGPPADLPPEQIATKGLLYLVADGVGVDQGGHVASRMAVEITRQAYYADPNPDIRASLADAIQQANQRIYHQRIGSSAHYSMSTTLTAVVVRGEELVVANVGDSRVYLVTGGQVQLLTVDHTWVEEKRRQGLLSDAEAVNHPQRHVITRSLGANLRVEVDIYGPRPFLRKQKLLLCTDGMSDLVSAPEIAALLDRSNSPGRAARWLVDLSKQRGAPDNVTAIVINRDGNVGGARTPWSNALALVGSLGFVALLAVGIIFASDLLGQRSSGSLPAPTPTGLHTDVPATTIVEAVEPGLHLLAPEPDEQVETGEEIKFEWLTDRVLEGQDQFELRVESVSGGVVFTRTVNGGSGDHPENLNGEYQWSTSLKGVEAGEYRWWVQWKQYDGEMWRSRKETGWQVFFVRAPAAAPTPEPPTQTPTPEPPTPTPTPEPPTPEPPTPEPPTPEPSNTPAPTNTPTTLPPPDDRGP